MSGSPCAGCPHLKTLLMNPDPVVLLAHGLPPVRLAELLGVHRSTTCRWFRDGRIPESARYNVGRELLAVIHGGGRHDG
ncbi:MAG: hypothetical protein EOM37_15165 [Proteobacteria bacterium]|nr:hypothetical protein [Pseudomonadota bacterium]